jgi:hypothetical protein
VIAFVAGFGTEASTATKGTVNVPSGSGAAGRVADGFALSAPTFFSGECLPEVPAFFDPEPAERAGFGWVVAGVSRDASAAESVCAAITEENDCFGPAEPTVAAGFGAAFAAFTVMGIASILAIPS